MDCNIYGLNFHQHQPLLTLLLLSISRVNQLLTLILKVIFFRKIKSSHRKVKLWLDFLLKKKVKVMTLSLLAEKKVKVMTWLDFFENFWQFWPFYRQKSQVKSLTFFKVIDLTWLDFVTCNASLLQPSCPSIWWEHDYFHSFINLSPETRFF
jgi:hypothetical protein